ncbi:hypothetical protein DFH07DRAFT_1064274 [Mycena maculata]|uniref:Uncharacterized protein n=1 Tax=Mycena maculata TaxID=230809 RepID=A0AAD7IDG1_9AGAR|nr:hypothetical protein DFH07DRAFT_1064274 [Mycena maculata]
MGTINPPRGQRSLRRRVCRDSEARDTSRPLQPRGLRYISHTGILGTMSLPALRTLQLSEMASEFFEALKMFMSRSQCTLDQLCADGASLQESTFCEALPSIGVIVVPVEEEEEDRLPRWSHAVEYMHILENDDMVGSKFCK